MDLMALANACSQWGAYRWGKFEEQLAAESVMRKEQLAAESVMRKEQLAAASAMREKEMETEKLQRKLEIAGAKAENAKQLLDFITHADYQLFRDTVARHRSEYSLRMYDRHHHAPCHM